MSALPLRQLQRTHRARGRAGWPARRIRITQKDGGGMTKKKTPKLGEEVLGDLGETVVKDPSDDQAADARGEEAEPAPLPAHLVEVPLERGTARVTKHSFGEGREYLVYDEAGHSYHHVADDPA